MPYITCFVSTFSKFIDDIGFIDRKVADLDVNASMHEKSVIRWQKIGFGSMLMNLHWTYIKYLEMVTVGSIIQIWLSAYYFQGWVLVDSYTQGHCWSLNQISIQILNQIYAILRWLSISYAVQQRIAPNHRLSQSLLIACESFGADFESTKKI